MESRPTLELPWGPTRRQDIRPAKLRPAEQLLPAYPWKMAGYKIVENRAECITFWLDSFQVLR